MQLSDPTSNKSTVILRRLLRMGPRELTVRGRQAAYKWADRLNATSGRGRSQRTRARSTSFLSNAEARFFQGPFDTRLAGALNMGAFQHYEQLLATADEICRGRFDLLGFRGLELGMSPDWLFDPTSNRRAPLVHWSHIDPLANMTVGDSKVIWELNRHQWMVLLAQAYFLTGDERYAQTVVRHLSSWQKANPYGIGINWVSSLEVAFRLIAWCWTLLLIRDSRALSRDVLADLVESVRLHATHIERYLSTYFSPNTHLTGEALGLFYAGVLFTELKRAGRWQSLATRILLEELERQVLADGVYFERSTYYQRYTVDIYLHFIILAERVGIEVPAIVPERVQALLDFLITVRQPDGSMPSIGDADGGYVLPLSTSQPHDFRSGFSTAAVLFKSSTYAWAAGELAPETLWLLGTSAFDTFEAIEPKEPPAEAGCRIYPQGGFAVMRSGWDAKSHSLIFDTGPLGCHFSSGHGHADLLSIQCSAFGQPYLIDAGTYCYTGDQKLRDFFRGTAAHSTVMIDGKSQAEPGGPFSWQSRCAAQLLKWSSDETMAFADAEHDGYRALPDPVTHRRRVIFVKERYWIVVDDLMGTAAHRIDLRFQFAPVRVQIDSAGWARATADGRRGLLLRSFTSTPMVGEVREGCRDPLEGWVSPNYGQIERAPVLIYTAMTTLPMRIVTLLWPVENIHADGPRVEIIPRRNGDPGSLMFPDFGETVLFEDGEPMVERCS